MKFRLPRRAGAGFITATSDAPLGVPRPVHASHPTLAAYPPLLPLVMSRRAEEFRYRTGFRKPTRKPSVWFNSAVKPAHSGATPLVPKAEIFCPKKRSE